MLSFNKNYFYVFYCVYFKKTKKKLIKFFLTFTLVLEINSIVIFAVEKTTALNNISLNRQNFQKNIIIKTNNQL